MRTIIAGSRSCNNYSELLEAIASLPWTPTVVLSGTARGVDRLGERWANENRVPLEEYPADWNRYGRSAGYRRNAEMAQKADALLALWDGKSKGTGHMIRLAEKFGLKLHIWRIA